MFDFCVCVDRDLILTRHHYILWLSCHSHFDGICAYRLFFFFDGRGLCVVRDVYLRHRKFARKYQNYLLWFQSNARSSRRIPSALATHASKRAKHKQSKQQCDPNQAMSSHLPGSPSIKMKCKINDEKRTYYSQPRFDRRMRRVEKRVARVSCEE